MRERMPHAHERVAEGVLREIFRQVSLAHHGATQPHDVPRVTLHEPLPGAAKVTPRQEAGQLRVSRRTNILGLGHANGDLTRDLGFCHTPL